MNITFEQYSRSREWLTTTVEKYNVNGIFTDDQTRKIWKHFEDIMQKEVDKAVAAGAKQVVYEAPKPDTSSGGFMDWMSNESTKFKDRIDGGAKAAGGAVVESVVGGLGGMLNYVVLGIIALVVITIVKK